MRRERILGYAERELGADGIELFGPWMGYEAWMPKWSQGPPDIGPPVFVLVRGESIRLTDPDEGFAILREWVRTHPDAERARTGPNRSQTLYPPFSY